MRHLHTWSQVPLLATSEADPLSLELRKVGLEIRGTYLPQVIKQERAGSRDSSDSPGPRPQACRGCSGYRDKRTPNLSSSTSYMPGAAAPSAANSDPGWQPVPTPFPRREEGSRDLTQAYEVMPSPSAPITRHKGGRTYPWLLLDGWPRTYFKAKTLGPRLLQLLKKFCSRGPSPSRSPGGDLTSCLQQTGTTGSPYVSR